MKLKKIKSVIRVHENFHELNGQQKDLLMAAKANIPNAYAPYSNFLVSAALRLKNGEIIKGHNFENASYPLCLCAERVALAAATSTYPDGVVTSMAITVKNLNQKIKKPVSPCGACRQVILEVELKQKHDIEIILQGEKGEIYILDSCKQLLPLYFESSFLGIED